MSQSSKVSVVEKVKAMRAVLDRYEFDDEDVEGVEYIKQLIDRYEKDNQTTKTAMKAAREENKKKGLNADGSKKAADLTDAEKLERYNAMLAKSKATKEKNKASQQAQSVPT